MATVAPALSLSTQEALWVKPMPAAIRRERLLSTLHPRASSAWSGVRFGNHSSEAPKQELFVDAPEAMPDTLVRGEDVCCDQLEVPNASNEDTFDWWCDWFDCGADGVIAEVKSCDLIPSGTGKQGSKVQGVIAAACKVTSGVLCALIWAVISKWPWGWCMLLSLPARLLQLLFVPSCIISFGCCCAFPKWPRGWCVLVSGRLAAFCS
jgi:hypothetical protein